MKPLRLLLIPILVLSTTSTFADEGSLLTDAQKNYVGFGAIFLMLILFLWAMLATLRAFKVISHILLGPEAIAQANAEKVAVKAAKPKASIVNKLLSLKPLSEEKSLVMDHEYDGIQELNNPTPPWFMYLFYATIVFAVCYIFIYHVAGIGQLQYDEYKTEMAVAAKEKAIYLAKSANKVDESTVKLTTDAATLSSGQSVFKQNCTPCHGEHAQGVVGPNLTDDYWLHGGTIKDVFKTIEYGVSAKGMPSWEKQLSPKQIADVANYVKSLHGTNPANAKEPQGDKMASDDSAAPKKADAKGTVKTAMVVK